MVSKSDIRKLAIDEPPPETLFPARKHESKNGKTQNYPHTR